MNYDILLKFGEIALKGANRAYFENTLARQIRYRIKPYGRFEVFKSQSTICVRPLCDDCDLDGAYGICKKTFGIIALARAYECDKDIEKIKALAVTLAPELLSGAKTFKVEAKRSDKRFPYDSPAICAEVGAAILASHHGVTVDVHEPDVVVRVEIRDEKAYVTGRQEKGAGGMPVWTNGKAMLLLSGGIDSPVAGYRIAKRGVQIEAVYFHAPPYTSERAKQKVVDLATLISEYTGPIRLHVVNFTDIQMAIYENCPHDELTIIMRRFMMRIAEYFAKKVGCLGLVTGESIGQVASQTMQSMLVTNEVCTIPVYRPLCAFDKLDIVAISEKIDAYETSILPYEDCCTIFVAKHPVTKPKLEKIVKSEHRLDDIVDEIMQRALETTEVIEI